MESSFFLLPLLGMLGPALAAPMPSAPSASSPSFVLPAINSTASVSSLSYVSRMAKKETTLPNALPQNASARAILFQPVLDYDTDSCYNIPAIDAAGYVAKGLTAAYTTFTKDCREPSYLDNQNVYVRERCNNGWCAYMYEHYFQKDVALQYVAGSGHRHEWENIVVFAKDNESFPRLVSASRHDGYEVRDALKVRFQDSNPKIVYHKEGISTHAFRFAREKDDKVENHKETWIRGALVDWNGFPSTALRDRMIEAFAPLGIKPKIDDEHFKKYLEKAMRGYQIPNFDPFLKD